jgi:membrane protease YdiL (CAAX protease family)
VSRARLFSWTGLIAVLAAVNYYGRFHGSSGSTSSRNEVYSYGAFASGLFVYAFWLGLVLAMAAGRWDLLALRRPASWRRAAAWAVAIVVTIVGWELVVAALPIRNPGDEQGLAPKHWEPAHAGAFAANLVLFAVVAPFVEELTFRGVGQSLLRFLGRWPAILIVGVAFGLAHGLVEALLVLVPFGIALAWLRDRTRSVLPGMVVHGLFNGLALAAAVLT